VWTKLANKIEVLPTCAKFAGSSVQTASKREQGMSQLTISTELVRHLRHRAPDEVTDYRDPKLPGFVLRARPSGIHSWRVQLPNRRWLTIGRVDEVALSDAREAAQTRRAGRDSANKWRRERGYKSGRHTARTRITSRRWFLALNTGLRRGELLQLRWRDLDLQRRDTDGTRRGGQDPADTSCAAQ
jgi:hypothetical protein